VFMTGNWDAAFSSDGGHTFKELNPYSMMLQGTPGFGCDQIVQYVPQINRFVWLLQSNTGSNNGLSSPFGGDSSVRKGDLDAGAAEVDHRDQRVC